MAFTPLGASRRLLGIFRQSSNALKPSSPNQSLRRLVHNSQKNGRSIFPATLFHYRPAAKALVFDASSPKQLFDEYFEYHQLLEDGLVHPRVEDFTRTYSFSHQLSYHEGYQTYEMSARQQWPRVHAKYNFHAEFTRTAFGNHQTNKSDSDPVRPTIVHIIKGR